jgi:YidC/Oxa1 family membrane protein insertase
MDRNTIIGALLIGVILILWMTLMSPSQKPVPKVQPKKTDSIAAAIELDSLKAQEEKRKLASLGSFSSATSGTEELLTVETDLFTAKLSTKGATLRSFVQKNYVNGDKEPFDLITNKQGATSLFFATRDGKTINTTDLFFTTTAKTIKLTGDQIASVPFELALADGRKIAVTYGFSGNSYKIDFQTGFTGMQSTILGDEFQVVWTGGLTHSEKNQVDEVAMSYAHADQNGSLVKLDAEKPDETYKQQPDGKTKWVSVQSKYFVAAIIPEEEGTGVYMTGQHLAKNDKEVFEDYTVAVKNKLDAAPVAEIKKNFRFYVGPLDYRLVKSLGVELERTMDFGWEWLTRPIAEWVLLPIFRFLNNYIASYGIIIILFALLIKVVTYPLTATQMNSMKKMGALQPQMQAIQEKYKNDPQKLQAEVGKLYKEAGVNPLSGCLPLLLQMPLLYAMYNVFRASIELRQESFLWADDLSIPDAIVHFPFSIPLYGDHIAVYPILMALSIFLQQKITPQQSNPAADQMKVFNMIMPVMFLFFFNNLPAGLGLYYLMFNIFGIAQQFYTNWQMKQTPPATVIVQPPPKAKKKEKVA